ncbi:MAG: helix-turn-helix domain-containing protein [Actinomycetota bacterium]
MTKSAVAAYTKMSERWVQRHAAELGGFSLGGRTRFRLADVDAYIERHSLRPRRRDGRR